MTPPKKKRRRLPKNVIEKDDHDLMEAVVGKRAMRQIDAAIGDGEDDEKEVESSTQRS